MAKIILILGDQLNLNIAALKNCDKKNDIILMCEVIEECTTPKHHKKKIVFILSAMRHFAAELEKQGFNLCYVKLDDKNNSGSFQSELLRISKQYNLSNITVTHPSEYRVLQDLKTVAQEHNLKMEILDDDRFLCDIAEFKEFCANKKTIMMEYFYRQMRLKYQILVTSDNKPVGGKWNYDAQNRKPPKSGLKIPNHYQAKPDKITQEVMELVAEKFADHFGDIEPFYLAVDRAEALLIFQDFVNNRLHNFGHYQDAMIENEDFMFHSHISFYLNIGLLLPLELIQLVAVEYEKGKVALNSAEGFIRQILGWREYVRGIYWLKMPQYKELNFLHAKRKLPKFYWDGETKMNCMKESIRNTKQNSYAHHIQRLMVLGNFALISSIDPKEVNEWYFIVYSDAYEWVELPNVSGMILFADGGFLGSKPYAASGSYINKMSNYCKNCIYDVKEKNGEKACPFNYLYWNFLLENKDILGKNHRMMMIYRVLEKFTDNKIKEIKDDSQKFFKSIA